METLFALLIMFAAFTVGLAGIAIVMMIMGLTGAPGAMLFEIGRKTSNAFLSVTGFILTAIGQTYIVGAYIVLVVALLQLFALARPDVPTWPLWIAAFFHSGAVPVYGMKEKPTEPTAQHYTLGIVALLAAVIFFVAVFVPAILRPLYGWVPYFGNLLK